MPSARGISPSIVVSAIIKMVVPYPGQRRSSYEVVQFGDFPLIDVIDEDNAVINDNPNKH